MATHTSLPIYKVAYDLIDVVTDFAKNMPRPFQRPIGSEITSDCIRITILIFRANVAQDKEPHLLALIERLQVVELMIRLAMDKRLISKDATANSYFGLLRQTTHGHHDRARMANVLRKRGHSIKADLTKTYRKKLSHGA